MKITSPYRLLAALLLCTPLGALHVLPLPGLAATPPAPGDMQRAHVPAGARWVGHFDLQVFQRTALWQRLVQLEGFEEEALMELGEMKRELGIDPLRDVFSVTVYGLGEDEEEAVVLIETTTAIDHALERFAKEDGYRLVSHQGLDVHSWTDEGYVHVIARPGDRRLVVVAPRIDNLVEGVRVVQGQTPSLAGGAAARLSAAPMAGSFVFFACADGIPGIHEIDPASRVANLATGLVFDLGESGGELFVRASVQTADVDAALDLTDVCDGLVALARLALSSQDVPAEVTSVMRALRVETRGTEVWIEFRYSVDQLLQVFEQLSQHDEEHEGPEAHEDAIIIRKQK